MSASATGWRAMTRRWIAEPLEGIATWLFFHGMRRLSLDQASAFGGKVARWLGPRLPHSNRARKNLRRCFPTWSEAEIEAVVAEVWENLGRVAGEFPNRAAITAGGPEPRVELVGQENLEAALAEEGPAIFFSAHLANWEVLPLIARERGIPVTVVYRELNNPLGGRVMRQAREGYEGQAIAKGPTAGRKLLAAAKRGDRLALLIDQKLNEGTMVPFFGRPAMTTPIAARLALHFRCPLVPVRCERLAGAHFRTTYYPALTLPDSGDKAADELALLTTINDIVEDWVRARPGQWLWLHRRWIDNG